MHGNPTAMADDPLMTVPEVAAAMGVCTETVYRHVRAGELAVVRVGRGKHAMRVLASDLQAFVAARRGHGLPTR